MLDTSFSCAGLPATRAAARGEPVPRFTVETLVIEGDSITSTTPSTPAGGFYSYRYLDSRADLAIEVRAQASRAVGGTLDDDSNTLMGNVAEDAAYAPDLVTALIGANDMAAGTAAAYKANLATWYAALKAARPGCRVAWSAPIPYNPDESHPNHANFTTQRAIVMADARDPAVWGQWADYYLPLAEHPDWVDIGSALYGDGVHPTAFDAVNGTGGQNRLYDQYKAAVDSIADASRTYSTAPFASVWPADEAGLSPGVPIVRRIVLSGLAHAGVASRVSVAGGDARVRLNGAAYAADTSGASGWLYNGDVIELRLTPSPQAETKVTIALTIGSETREIGYTSAAEAMPVAYAHGDVTYVQPGGGATHAFEDVELADGLALLAFNTQNSLISVTLTPRAGGTAIGATRLFEQGGAGNLSVWTAPVAAGAYDIAIALSGWSKTSVLSYGTVLNADPEPAQVVSSGAQEPDDLYVTPTMTVPANGLALVFFNEYGGGDLAAATVNSPTVPIDEGHSPAFQGEAFGLTIGTIPASGFGSFGTGSGGGSNARGGVVFAAARGEG